MNLLDRLCNVFSSQWVKSYFDPKKTYKLLRKSRKRTRLLIDGKAKWFGEIDFVNGRVVAN